MWESLLKIGSGLLDFARGTKKNAEDIKKANQRIDEISNILLAAVIRMDNLEKMEAKDREILALKISNILLEHGVDASQLRDLKPRPPLLPPDEMESKNAPRNFRFAGRFCFNQFYTCFRSSNS